jgi:hypothetical protein
VCASVCLGVCVCLSVFVVVCDCGMCKHALICAYVCVVLV